MELNAPKSTWIHSGSICVSGVCTGNTVMHISWGMCAGDMGMHRSEYICKGLHIMSLSRHGLWIVCGSAECSQNFNMESPGLTTFCLLFGSEDGRQLVSQLVLRGSPTCCF